jgi:hypothetical protein
LPPDVLEARIASGAITPELEGTAVASFKGEPAGSRNSRRRDLTDSQERIAELEAEVEALHARIAELETSQSNGAPAVAVRVIEPLTDEDRQRSEREGQQRLPFEEAARRRAAEATSAGAGAA